MRLEHVNLVVRDIERSLAFYKAACPHWNIRSEGQSESFDQARGNQGGSHAARQTVIPSGSHRIRSISGHTQETQAKTT